MLLAGSSNNLFPSTVMAGPDAPHSPGSAGEKFSLPICLSESSRVPCAGRKGLLKCVLK